MVQIADEYYKEAIEPCQKFFEYGYTHIHIPISSEDEEQANAIIPLAQTYLSFIKLSFTTGPISYFFDKISKQVLFENNSIYLVNPDYDQTQQLRKNLTKDELKLLRNNFKDLLNEKMPVELSDMVMEYDSWNGKDIKDRMKKKTTNVTQRFTEQMTQLSEYYQQVPLPVPMPFGALPGLVVPPTLPPFPPTLPSDSENELDRLD
jgi:hypothetical protein